MASLSLRKETFTVTTVSVDLPDLPDGSLSWVWGPSERAVRLVWASASGDVMLARCSVSLELTIYAGQWVRANPPITRKAASALIIDAGVAIKQAGLFDR